MPHHLTLSPVDTRNGMDTRDEFDLDRGYLQESQVPAEVLSRIIEHHVLSQPPSIAYRRIRYQIVHTAYNRRRADIILEGTEFLASLVRLIDVRQTGRKAGYQIRGAAGIAGRSGVSRGTVYDRLSALDIDPSELREDKRIGDLLRKSRKLSKQLRRLYRWRLTKYEQVRRTRPKEEGSSATECRKLERQVAKVLDVACQRCDRKIVLVAGRLLANMIQIDVFLLAFRFADRRKVADRDNASAAGKVVGAGGVAHAMGISRYAVYGRIDTLGLRIEHFGQGATVWSLLHKSRKCSQLLQTTTSFYEMYCTGTKLEGDDD